MLGFNLSSFKGSRQGKKSVGFFSGKKAFGDVASTLIMFVAIIGVSTGLVIAIKNYAIDTQESFDFQNKVITNQLKTSIDIINVYYDDTTNMTYVYLKNIGKTKLVVGDFDMFIDDDYITNYSVYYADNLSKELELLNLMSTAVFVKEYNLTTGSHKVKLVTGFGGSGDTEYFNK